MINKIKKRIEEELPFFLKRLDSIYRLKKISPLLFSEISDFVLRPGKRARPILFIIGFKGYAGKEPRGLYTSALSLELLHDFMLVHDDIIDKSELRRGKPALHTAFNHYLKKFSSIKFNGEDLAIVAGDIMYAMGLNAFLSAQVPFARKEKSLKKLIDAAVFTGFGEFIELLSGTKSIAQITRKEIDTIYDFKTACYTFATPLAMGALLADAPEKEAEKLFTYGIYLGRAFQMKDDILGIFGEEKHTGKSSIADLQEAKKTILIWYAYHHTLPQAKTKIQRILSKKDRVSLKDLNEARRIIAASGALQYTKNQIHTLKAEAEQLLSSMHMNRTYQNILSSYGTEILSV